MGVFGLINGLSSTVCMDNPDPVLENFYTSYLDYEVENKYQEVCSE